MAAAEVRAAELGFERMHLTVDPSNARAISFYEKLGWQREPSAVRWTGSLAKAITPA